MSTYAYRQAAGIRQALLDRRELALIDVREEADFATAHPLFAVNLPLSKLELEVRRRIPRFTTPLTVYDNGEGLAEIAVERLRSWGYQDVALLAEGLAGWRRSGGELFQDVNSASKAFGELVESVRHTPSLSAQEVQALIDSRQEVVIVDARRFDEYQTMSIPGSISVPGGELALRVESLTPSPQTPVIVNCAGRTRSIIGTQSLINAGVPNPVHALRNGTIGWTLAGQTLAHQQQRQYDPSAPAPPATELEARRHKHELTHDYTENLPLIMGDRGRIEQVMLNVLSNAVKYTPDGGHIRVTAGSEGETVWMEVADDGIGIPEADRSRIFERFYRVDKARSRESGGTGLGLSIATEIVQRHHGSLTLVDRPGPGTTVRLELPITQPIGGEDSHE